MPATRQQFLPANTDRTLATMAAAEAKPWGLKRAPGRSAKWFASREEAESYARSLGTPWIWNRWNNRWFDVRETR